MELRSRIEQERLGLNTPQGLFIPTAVGLIDQRAPTFRQKIGDVDDVDDLPTEHSNCLHHWVD